MAWIASLLGGTSGAAAGTAASGAATAAAAPAATLPAAATQAVGATTASNLAGGAVQAVAPTATKIAASTAAPNLGAIPSAAPTISPIAQIPGIAKAAPASPIFQMPQAASGGAFDWLTKIVKPATEPGAVKQIFGDYIGREFGTNPFDKTQSMSPSDVFKRYIGNEYQKGTFDQSRQQPFQPPPPVQGAPAVYPNRIQFAQRYR
jgi:hypothetical protein